MRAPLHFTIAPGDDAPIYRQLVRQVREAIAAGRLAAGDRLQSHRELAQQLVISPLTVKKAYDELERAGLITTARGQGTFVRAGVARASAKQRREGLRAGVRRLVHEAHLSGVEPEALLVLVEEETARLRSRQAGTTEIKP
jgi:GntR family transcriptional regulator